MRQASRFRLFAPALVAGVLLSGGCGGDTPDPAAPTAPVAPPAAPLKDADLVAIVLTDAIERILPSLREDGNRTLLVNAFGNLAAAVNTRVVKSVQVHVRESRDALAAFATPDADEIARAELDAIRLYLDYVDEKITETLSGL